MHCWYFHSPKILTVYLKLVVCSWAGLEFYRRLGKASQISEVYNREKYIWKTTDFCVNVRKSHISERNFIHLIFINTFFASHMLVYLTVQIVHIYQTCFIGTGSAVSVKMVFSNGSPILSVKSYTRIVHNKGDRNDIGELRSAI